MKSFFKLSAKRWYIFVSLLLIVPLFALAMKMSGFIVTFTGSMPIGIYRIIKVQSPLSIARGDDIGFCLPPQVAAVGLARGYLESGPCPGGSSRLLKKVIALPGDRVVVGKSQLTVYLPDGSEKTYFAPRLTDDGDGKPIKRWVPAGQMIVAKGYWVYGSGDRQDSWDSRYYGGIPKRLIESRIKPVLTF